MSSLKSIVSNIEKEKQVEEMERRQLKTNIHAQSFRVKYPVVQEDYSNEELQKRLAQACRDIGDIQKSSTNVQASMTGWFMHETNPDFMEVCRIATELAYEHSPRQGVALMPYDCWGAIYSKGNYTKTHAHWPMLWSWVYNVESCINCAPLIFNDSSHSTLPKSGSMILFPAWVGHYVPEQQCDHDRIILSGNIGMNPWQFILGMEKRSASGISEEFKKMAEWLY